MEEIEVSRSRNRVVSNKILERGNLRNVPLSRTKHLCLIYHCYLHYEQARPGGLKSGPCLRTCAQGKGASERGQRQHAGRSEASLEDCGSA
jgi:hypothetical protein